MQPGLKADLNLADQKTYWQPRLNGKYPFTEKLSLNFGWGVYRQFISKTAIIDENGLRSELWHTLNGKQLPFVNSMHHVAGLSYLSEKWEFNVEGFYKTAQNILRFYATPEKVLPKRGAARAYGIDFFLKKRFARHEFWTSYSLGKAEDRFFWVQDKGYTDAGQSQKHEIKSALVLDFSPFHFSATNVYGSGFPNFFENGQPSGETVPYWRVDAALRYDFDIKKSRWEAGVSVINLFNRQIGQTMGCHQWQIYPHIPHSHWKR